MSKQSKSPAIKLLNLEEVDFTNKSQVVKR